MQANASNPASELAGEFTFTVLPYPGQTLDRYGKNGPRSHWWSLRKRGVTDDDLNRFKASYEAGTDKLLYPAVAVKFLSWPAYQTFTGNPNYMAKRYETAHGCNQSRCNAGVQPSILKAKKRLF